MYLRNLTLPIFIFLLATVSYGQRAQTSAQRATPPQAQQAQAQAESSTKLETFQAKTGAVIVKGYKEVGSLSGLGGTVTVTSWEFLDAQSGRKEHGIGIEVKESGRLEREERSFIDYDEIDSLIKGLDYISKIDASVSKLGNFEAEYKTRGEFSVTTFGSDRGIRAAISAGRLSHINVFIDLDKLPAFRKLVTDAKADLDSIRQ